MDFIFLHGGHHVHTGFPLITGLIASIAHVLSGPDHLAAVTPIAIESKNKSWVVGLMWGIGHMLGMLLIGVLFLIFKDVFPIDEISAYSEQIVGVILIGIGIWAILRVYKIIGKKSHVHPHLHEESQIIHVHQHSHEQVHQHSGHHQHKHKKTQKQNIIASLSIGILHGLAGVSHLVAILPTLALPSKLDSGMYLTGFGLGTIIAMIGFSFLLGYIALKSSEARKEKIYNSLRLIGGIAAILVGIFWIFRTF